MKLSEKIQEALCEQQEINLSDPAVQKRLAAQWGYVPAEAQPTPNAVAYLDLGVGGYMDIGTDLTDEELDAIPKGRHMLGIVGTYGIEGYVPAQPAPSFADAYQGAMEEVAIWKKRALEAEDLNRKFIAEINGPTYMGEQAQPAPSCDRDTHRTTPSVSPEPRPSGRGRRRNG